MTHWAAAYVGAGYARGASGPEVFSCWGLVRHVFLHVHRIAFADVSIDESAPASPVNSRAILACARAASMRPVPAGQPPADGDIVIMRSLVQLHCGLVVRLNGGLRVLHAAQDRGVVVDHWRDAVEGMSWELWRRA